MRGGARRCEEEGGGWAKEREYKGKRRVRGEEENHKRTHTCACACESAKEGKDTA